MYFHVLNFHTSQAVRKYFINEIFTIYGSTMSCTCLYNVLVVTVTMVIAKYMVWRLVEGAYVCNTHMMVVAVQTCTCIRCWHLHISNCLPAGDV